MFPKLLPAGVEAGDVVIDLGHFATVAEVADTTAVFDSTIRSRGNRSSCSLRFSKSRIRDQTLSRETVSKGGIHHG